MNRNIKLAVFLIGILIYIEHRLEIKKIFACHECGNNDNGGGIGGWSVSCEMWKMYGNGEGMLCIACFERKLGRKLIKEDFTDTLDNKTSYAVRRITL